MLQTRASRQEYYQKKNADLEARKAAVKVAGEETRKQKITLKTGRQIIVHLLKATLKLKETLKEGANCQLIGSTLQSLRRQEEHNAQRMERLFTQEDEVQDYR